MLECCEQAGWVSWRVKEMLCTRPVLALVICTFWLLEMLPHNQYRLRSNY